MLAVEGGTSITQAKTAVPVFAVAADNACGATPLYSITDELQKKHRSICMIRALEGLGTTPVSAMTLANEDSDFRYISVRRTIDAIERSIQPAVLHLVFDPNTSSTWQALKAGVTNYLYAIWKQDGLQGRSPEQAFFVQVGEGETMTPEDVRQGWLRIKIGVALLRPADFVVLEIAEQIWG